QGRQLITQRLPAARRHQHDRVAAGGDVLDDLLLPAAEARVAEDAAQQAKGGWRFLVAHRTDCRFLLQARAWVYSCSHAGKPAVATEPRCTRSSRHSFSSTLACSRS